MKKIITLITAMTITLTSCEEEVFIDEIATVADTRLVIEANIDIDKSSTKNTSTQTIKLSNTTSFYNKNFLGVKGATITVLDDSGNSVGTFLDINTDVDEIEDGIYTATDFKTPNIGDTYNLRITVNGQTYTASDTYTSIVDINEIKEEPLDGFEDTLQIIVNIDNEIDVDNYYLFEIDTPDYVIPEFEVADDGFFSEEPGKNNYDFTYFDEELEKGDIVDIKVYGISKSYNNYLVQLLATAQGNDGPFSTAPATVRGNILNNTNQDNYALGFFSLNQFVNAKYIITDSQ